MDLTRAAASAVVLGGILVSIAVGLLAGAEWALLAVGVLLMAAGLNSLRSLNG